MSKNNKVDKVEKVKLAEFGDPILRRVAQRVDLKDIKSEEIQTLIKRLREACDANKYGVGIAAPQIGVSQAVLVIKIKSTPSRPNLNSFDKVVINPEIIEYIGQPVQLWDGCLSGGADPLFAQTERYKKIRVNYYDEDGEFYEDELIDGFVAHVFQHETDHVNGMLFVDRVTNSKSWMSNSEYLKMMKIV
jgi:peptide deformylase